MGAIPHTQIRDKGPRTNMCFLIHVGAWGRGYCGLSPCRLHIPPYRTASASNNPCFPLGKPLLCTSSRPARSSCWLVEAAADGISTASPSPSLQSALSSFCKSREVSFYLPVVPCSTPARLHPSYLSAKQACDSWLLSSLGHLADSFPHGVVRDEMRHENLVSHMYPLFVCLTVPFAEEATVLPLCKLLAWLFLMDDLADELAFMGGDAAREAKFYEHLLSLLISDDNDDKAEEARGAAGDGKNLLQSTMVSLLKEVWAEVKAVLSSKRQQQRLIQTLRRTFEATIAQSRMREGQGIVLNLDSYIAIREITGGAYVFVVLAEIGLGLDLQVHMLGRHGPLLCQLQDLVASHVAYVNDLLSFRKEYCHGHYQNLPSILCMHHGHTMQEAIGKLRNMIERADQEFERVKGQLMRDINTEKNAHIDDAGDEKLMRDVNLYVESLGYIKSGFLEWGYHTGRYHGLHNHLTLRHGLVSLIHPEYTLITQSS